MAATLLGATMRAQIVLSRASFPLNDGGLFYRMTQDLLEDRLFLPQYTTYNQAHIPFAYPPLGLYLAAILTTLGWPLEQLFRFIPLTFSVLSIPAFYDFAVHYFGERLPAALATLVFAFLPETFEWRIMGGGITRSLGFLFGLLALASTYRMLRDTGWQRVLVTGMLGAAAVLTHPEAAVQFALGCLLLLLVFGRRREVLLAGAESGAIAALISSIWWLPVLNRNGPAMLGAVTEASTWSSLLGLLADTLDHLDPLTCAFALLGAMANRNYRTSWLWLYAAMMLLVPRSAPQFLVIPIALLGGIGLALIWTRVLHQTADTPGGDTKTKRPETRGAVGLAIVALLMFLPNWVDVLTSPLLTPLSPSELAAMQWIDRHTDRGSLFIVVEGVNFAYAKNGEWLPALTNSSNVVAVQGTEWLTDASFSTRIALHTSLQQCGNQDAGCLEAWMSRNQLQFDYAYVLNPVGQPAANASACCSSLVKSMSASPRYTRVFENDDVAIFRRQR